MEPMVLLVIMNETFVGMVSCRDKYLWHQIMAAKVLFRNQIEHSTLKGEKEEGTKTTPNLKAFFNIGVYFGVFNVYI